MLIHHHLKLSSLLLFRQRRAADAANGGGTAGTATWTDDDGRLIINYYCYYYKLELVRVRPYQKPEKPLRREEKQTTQSIINKIKNLHQPSPRHPKTFRAGLAVRLEADSEMIKVTFFKFKRARIRKTRSDLHERDNYSAYLSFEQLKTTSTHILRKN